MITREEIDGIAVLRRDGDAGATPLVLLHGIGSNAESFRPLIEALPDDPPVLAWNAPGYSGSRPLSMARPRPADYADALAALLDRLGWNRIALVGHSLGCLFATSFAVTYPSRVTTLALLSPALGYAVAPGAPLPPKVQARIDDLRALGPKEFARSRAPNLIGNSTERPDVLAAVEQAMAAVDPDGYAQAVNALAAGDLVADAARLTAPTLVAVGTRDRVTPPDNARAVHAALRSPLALHEIDGAGHALPQERPDAIAPLLARLVAEPAHV